MLDWLGQRGVLEHAAGHGFRHAAVRALPVKELEAALQSMGKDVTLQVYPGTGHAFANEENALGTYDEAAAREAWEQTLRFLHDKLG
mgnify:CR=1 FL=1